MNIGILGLELDRGAECGNRVVEVTLFLEGKSKIAMSLDIVRLELDGIVIGGNRLIYLTVFLPHCPVNW